MAYRTERLAIPKQCNKLRNDMLISAQERSIASKSQLKGHAHHYFMSPYRNSHAVTQYGDDVTVTSRELDDSHVTRELDDNLSPLSHTESMTALNALSPTMDTVNTKCDGETSRSLPWNEHPVPRDKLPAIVSINARKLTMRSQKDNSWLGPPNSIPPNKRSEHVAAYKTLATRPIVMHYADSVAATDVQSESETITDVPPLLIDRFPHKTIRYATHDDDAESSESLYPSDTESSDDADTFVSMTNETHFTHLRLIDRPFKHFPSPGTSLQLKSLAASTRYDDVSEHYSNNAIMLHYGESLSDSQSNLSANSHDRGRRKRVHFDPQVRDVTLENRPAPLTTNKPLPNLEQTSPRVNILLDVTPVCDSAVDQLPAVVEKFMIKSLPILPSINKSAINLNNANIIYIKGDGKTAMSGSVRHISKPVFISRNNFININRAGNTQTGSYQTGSVQHQHKTHTVTAVPQLSRVAEESSNPSASPSPTLKTTKATKITAPQKVVPASISANVTQNTSQYPNTTSTSNTQSTKSNPKKVGSKKTLKTEPKKATSVKSKTKGRKGRSSGSSSRNSPSMDSPINDVTDDVELREQRQREYAAAMLAVQQRMRVFDMRYGKSGDRLDEDQKDQSLFGKAIPPKYNPTQKQPKPGKQK